MNKTFIKSIAEGFCLLLLFSSCSRQAGQLQIEDWENHLKEKLSSAKKGDIIEIPEGKFEIGESLTLENVPFVTIKGKGPSRTVLSFKNQKTGAGLIFHNTPELVLENLSVHDTKSDGVIISESKNIIVRNVAVGWSQGASQSNGNYGIHIVSGKDALIEKCAITAASSAGLFISQSENVVLRDNVSYENVVGIQTENCTYADILSNKIFNNSCGILISDLPGLPVKNGHHIRISANVIKNNNLSNFSAENISDLIPSGTGICLISSKEAEISKNEITGHQTISMAVTSFLLTGKPYNDEEYNPYSSAIFVHHNKFEQSAYIPDTIHRLGKIIQGNFSSAIPDILFDGYLDPKFIEKDGRAREAGNICLFSNETKAQIKFANLNAPFDFKPTFDITHHHCELGELPSVEL